MGGGKRANEKIGFLLGSANKSVWKRPEKRAVVVFVLTFLVCVLWDYGGLVCWSALLYCTPPPPFLKSPVWLWHMHTGSVPQKCTHRHAATTEPWSRSKGISCVWGVTTGPHVAAVSHNPKSLLCLHRQTNGSGRGRGFNWLSLTSSPQGLRDTDVGRVWATWQVSSVEASGQRSPCTTQFSTIITMLNNLLPPANATPWRTQHLQGKYWINGVHFTGISDRI